MTPKDNTLHDKIKYLNFTHIILPSQVTTNVTIFTISGTPVPVPAPAPSLIGATPLHAIQRIINAMATCGDIRVRKNISIILAKGCRTPGIRDQVEKFRGLQIMIELQKQL